LLAESVVADTRGRARFVSENYGDSALAKRFGVARYPAIFVDDILVATPKDFGFYGSGEGAKDGRYAPFVKNAASYEHFRADLTRMVDLVIAGRNADARSHAVSAAEEGIAALPAFTLTDLDGRTLTRESLAGRPVLVEMWATWCPPCRGTLGWLGEMKKRYGDDLAVVTIAVESDEAGVRKIMDELRLPVVWAMGTPELIRSFGDIGGVPTLFLFDGAGKAAGTFFGAPPGLHGEVEGRLAPLVKAGSPKG
jgi:thiol-disulfide isomerase/thioredoxin